MQVRSTVHIANCRGQEKKYTERVLEEGGSAT